MKSKEELLQKHAEELKALELEQQRTASLPLPPDSFCGPTWKAPYLTYRKKDSYPRETYTLKEAYETVIEAYRPYIETAEVRTSGCTTIQPPAIMDPRYKDGIHKGDAYVQLVLTGGEGFSSTDLIFFAKVAGHFFHVTVEIQRHHEWHPSIRREREYYNERTGRDCSLGPYTITPRGIGEDHRIKYGEDRMKPNYHIVYMWADRDNFHSWVGKETNS